MKNREALIGWSIAAVQSAACGAFLAGVAIESGGAWWAQAGNALVWLFCGVSIGGVLTMRDVIAGRFRR